MHYSNKFISRNVKGFLRQAIVFLALALIIASAFYAGSIQKSALSESIDQSTITADQIVTANLRQIEDDNQANLIAINHPGAVLGDQDPPIISDENSIQDILDKQEEEKEALEEKVETPFAILVKAMDESGPRFSKNAQKRWPIASITKLITAVVALENLPEQDLVAISQNAQDAEGDAAGIRSGQFYTLEDLVKMMLTVSSNDAAVAVADWIGADNFKNLMQEKALSIGMNDTTFMEPTGLSYLNQSSAEDVFKLVNYIYINYPEVLNYSTKRQSQMIEHTSGQLKTLGTINDFAGREDFLGGKTGYTDEAGGNLVSVFKDKNGMPVVIVVFGSNIRFDASLDALAKYQELLAQ